MYGNFSKANMDTQTSSHMLLKNNSTEALNQILFPAREREIFEHLVFYYVLLYCGITKGALSSIQTMKFGNCVIKYPGRIAMEGGTK